MARLQPFAIGLLATCFAISFSGHAQAAVPCLSTNKTSPAECQSPAISNSSAPLPADSRGIYLGAGKEFVLFHSYGSILPKFISNVANGKNIFIPQGSVGEFTSFLNSASTLGVTVYDAIVPGRYTIKPVNVCGLKGLHILNPTTLVEQPQYLSVPNAGGTVPPPVKSLSDAALYTPLLSASASTFTGIPVVYKADNKPGYFYKEVQKIQFAPGKDANGNLMTCWGGTVRTAGPKSGQACDLTPPQVTASEFYYSKDGKTNWLPVQNVTCPEDGICGSDAGTLMSVTPTNLCVSGKASAVTLVNNSYYSWTCAGASGGQGVTCSTIGKAACNTALTAGDFQSGTPANRCSTGTSTAVTSSTAPSGETTWSWTCTSGTTSAGCSVTSAPVCTSCIGKEGTFGFSCPATPTCNDEAEGKVYDIYAASGASSDGGPGAYATLSMSMINASTRVPNIKSYASTINFPFFILGYYDGLGTLHNTGTWVNGVLVGAETDPAIIPGFAAQFKGTSSSLGYHQAKVNTDWYGICWDGSWTAPADGYYTFVTLVDDAIAMYIDGKLVGQDTDGFVPGDNNCDRGTYAGSPVKPLGSYWAQTLYTYKNPFAHTQDYIDLAVDDYLKSLGQTAPSCYATFKGPGTPYATAFKPIYLTKGTHEVELQYINGWATGIGLQAWVLSGNSYAPGAKVPSSALPNSALLTLGPPVVGKKMTCP